MGDIDRMINAFLDGKFDFETLDYQLDPSSPYYDEWLAKEKIRKEEEERAAKERPTGLDYFMQAKWSPARGTYLDGDVLPLSGAAARGGQDDDYISERVRSPDPPGMVPDPYGFDKVADFISKLDWKVRDRGRLAREADSRAAEGEQVRAGYWDPTDQAGTPPQAPPQAVDPTSPQPAGADRGAIQQQMWEQFQKMNPNLDYGAVARQSGAYTDESVPYYLSDKIPQGTFSDNSQNVLPPGQTDQDLYDFVNYQARMDEAQRKLDPRSRGYDQSGAEKLRAMAEEYANRGVTEQELQNQGTSSAADMIRARADKLSAEAQMKLAEAGLTRYGNPVGGDRGSGVDVAGLAKGLLASNEKFSQAEYDKAVQLINLGDERGALRILAPYIPELANNPEFATAPPGIRSGEEYVTPDGRIGVAP